MSEHSLIRASIRFALFAGAAMLPAAGVIAQEQPESEPQDSTLQEVVVTGSRIVSPNLSRHRRCRPSAQKTSRPPASVNVQDILLKNPTMGTPTLSRTNSALPHLRRWCGDGRSAQSRHRAHAHAGRRAAFRVGNPGICGGRLQHHPAQFIDRIDVLTGGASAVYGSDAVAGVVNIISRRISKASPSTASTARARERQPGDADRPHVRHEHR